VEYSIPLSLHLYAEISKNGDRAVRQIVAHGFRGCVSQVRILPGPLSGVGRTMLANLSFLGGKLPLVTCCR
jgi:hypothetical protein